MQQQTYKPLEKKDFKLLYGMVIICHIIATVISKFSFPIIIIACCSVLTSFGIAFFKLFRKPITNSDFGWVWGVVSIFNAIVMNLYFSLFFNTELKYTALIFTLGIIIIAIICALMKLLLTYSIKKSQSDNKKASSSRFSKFTKFGPTFGAVLGIYLSRSGIFSRIFPELTDEHIILACGIFIFSIFSVFLFIAKLASDYDEKNKLY